MALCTTREHTRHHTAVATESFLFGGVRVAEGLRAGVVDNLVAVGVALSACGCKVAHGTFVLTFVDNFGKPQVPFGLGLVEDLIARWFFYLLRGYQGATAPFCIQNGA